MLQDKSSSQRGWGVLAAATGINLTMGVNYSWSVIKKALVEDWHWSNFDATLPYTVYIAVFALTMVFAGRMQDKIGPRFVATLGAIFLGIGYIAFSLTEKLLPMVLAYGVVAAAGNSLCYATTIPPSVKWFPPELRGAVTGIVIGGVGMAAVYVSPIASWLVDNYGISQTFFILGAVSAVIIIALAQLLQNPPASVATEKPGPVSSIALRDLDWKEMIRSSTFYKLWLMYVFAASAGLMVIGHIVSIGKTQAGLEHGYYFVVALALSNTAGRFAAGVLSDRYGRVTLMLVVFLAQALNMLGFTYYCNSVLLVLGAVITGICYGASFALFPLATADFFGTKNLGGNYGLVFTAWGIAGFLGPLMAGWSVDSTTSYTAAYVTSSLLLLIATSIAFSLVKIQIDVRQPNT